MKTFSERLKYLLDKKSLKQADFRRLTNFTYGYVSNVLTGKREPGRETTEKIIKALNLTPSQTYWLMTGDDLTPSDKSEALTETFQRALDGDQAAIKEIDIKISELKLKYK